MLFGNFQNVCPQWLPIAFPTHMITSYDQKGIIKSLAYRSYLFFLAAQVFIAAQAFSSCSEQGLLFSCGAWASHCGGFSHCRAQALQHAGVVVVMCGLSCTVACRLFPDQGLNPCPLHWQADSYPLGQQRSPCASWSSSAHSESSLNQLCSLTAPSDSDGKLLSNLSITFMTSCWRFLTSKLGIPKTQ